MAAHYFDTDLGPAQTRDLVVELAGQSHTVLTAPGVFSPGHVDQGTAILLDLVPDPEPGDLLDLGCGWGPVALTAALRAPQVPVWALDVNPRALDLVHRNADRLGLARIRAVTPDEVPADLTFTTIWSNPPIRIGKPALHDLLGRWLPRLAPEGTAWLVVSRNLGADSLQTWITDQLGHPVERVGSRQGFRVLRVDARG